MKIKIIVSSRFVAVLSLALGFSASISADSAFFEKAKAEGKLVAYLAMNAADAVKVQTTFETKFPQIKVDLVRAGAPAMLQRILTEARGGKILADAVLGFGYIHHELARQKLL